MKCSCCYEEVEALASKCQVCKFPLLTVDGTDETELANQYRAEKLKDICIYLIQYNYQVENGVVQELEPDNIKLAMANELKYGEVLWLEQDREQLFPINPDRDIQLDLGVENADTKREVSVRIPKKDGNINRLGIVLIGGFKVAIAADYGQEIIQSESVSIIYQGK